MKLNKERTRKIEKYDEEYRMVNEINKLDYSI